jgi:hypothetical protein
MDQQVKNWATPMAGVSENSHGQLSGQFRREMDKAMNTTNGKLNPRWVCTLMNVPVFWVKP